MQVSLLNFVARRSTDGSQEPSWEDENSLPASQAGNRIAASSTMTTANTMCDIGRNDDDLPKKPANGQHTSTAEQPETRKRRLSASRLMKSSKAKKSNESEDDGDSDFIDTQQADDSDDTIECGGDNVLPEELDIINGEPNDVGIASKQVPNRRSSATDHESPRSAEKTTTKRSSTPSTIHERSEAYQDCDEALDELDSSITKSAPVIDPGEIRDMFSQIITEPIEPDVFDDISEFTIGTRAASKEQSNYYKFGIPHLVDNKYWQEYVHAYYSYCDHYNFPPWVDPAKLRDKDGNQPDSILFDLSQIKCVMNPKHPDHKQHCTPAMKQYWGIKSSSFDTILLFKLGKFYELFYTDAAIAHKYLNLKWMGSSTKAHVGFPENSLEYHCKKLLESQFKVSVCEQMETPAELAQRNTNETAVRREVCDIISVGCVSHSGMLDKTSSYLCSIYIDSDNKIAGVAICDVSLCQIELAEVSLDDSRPLHRLLSAIQPKEIVAHKANILCAANADYLTAVKAHCDNPLLSYVSSISESVPICISNIKAIYEQLPEAQDLRDKNLNFLQTHSPAALFTIEILLTYLQSNLLATKMLSTTIFSACDLSRDDYAFLPSSCIHSLEVHSSLFKSIDRCVTPSGSRLLLRWLLKPYKSIDHIEHRRRAVKTLLGDGSRLERITETLLTLSDLERSFGKYRRTGNASGRGAVYFNEPGNKKLWNLIEFIDHLHMAALMVSENLDLGISPIETTTTDLLQKIRNMIILHEKFKISVVPGTNAEHDAVTNRISEIETQIKESLNDLACFHSVGLSKLPASRAFVSSKFRYEIEIPETSEFNGILTSKRKGYIRFQPMKVASLLNELIFEEQKLDHAYHAVLSEILSNLKSVTAEIESIIRSASYIDVITCFAKLIIDENRVYPELLPDASPIRINLIQNAHPVMSRHLPKFVTNDIKLARGVVIIGGPNMGGKSTLSRQVLASAVLNQIGCPIFCAAGSQIAVFDKFFTRIGIYDRLLHKQSTFWLEANEVSEMLNAATDKSLLVVDEFGRGTSTSEGTLLASKTAEYIANTISCVSLFTTHFPLYKHLPESENVRYAHMGNENDINTFKLEPGLCPSSRGIRVAILAGVPQQIFYD